MKNQNNARAGAAQGVCLNCVHYIPFRKGPLGECRRHVALNHYAADYEPVFEVPLNFPDDSCDTFCSRRSVADACERGAR